MSSLALYRGIYTEERFQQVYGTPLEPGSSLAGMLRSRLARGCRCSRAAALHFLRGRLPIASWLPRYQPKKWLLGDVVAGLTVGIVHIPQGMAFALLTSVAPVYGLYTSFFPALLYMLFGTGRHVSTGTFAVVSLMTGSVVEHLVPMPQQSNDTDPDKMALLEGQRIGVAAAMAFLMGLLMIAMFTLHLGFLSTYLSEPVIKAFTSGAALHVVVSQLQSLLGLPLQRPDGCFAIFKTVASVVEALPLTNVAELLISGLCLAVLVPIKEINNRFRSRMRVPIPGEIIMVLLATGICFASSLSTHYNVQIVGHLPAGFPQPQLPALHLLPQVLGDTVALTFVAYAISVSLAMIYAEKHHYVIDPNQELLAHGLSNLVSSLFTCFPNSATLATTNILESAGGHTQLSGLFTSAVVLIVLMWIGPLFYYLPKAVLACINVTSLRQMFLQFQDLPELWRISHIDFAVWVVTWLSVVVLSVDLGLAVGVVFSMVTVVCRTQRAECSVLGRAADTEIYKPVKSNSKCFEIPGVKILSYQAPIYYGNRSFFRDTLSQLVGLDRDWEQHEDQGLESSIKMNISTVGSTISILEKKPDSGTALQAVILDCSAVAFVDSAGARLLIQVCVECQKAGVRMHLAACNAKVLQTLSFCGLMHNLNPQQIFVTVHDAVSYLQQTTESGEQKDPTIWV
ncbi:solute carrier family 26 member 10-like isoform X2 [Hemicordylus capensis]|uniref:solute carrier family 26 member 10-like isoform X2 n=1 Tax=Hemicordylus capensis TaxID=884348 RepID=UPI00230248A2|nr:solute carrier family 26 member 10-like isoform X2 [Hemicordylus capensis]